MTAARLRQKANRAALAMLAVAILTGGCTHHTTPTGAANNGAASASGPAVSAGRRPTTAARLVIVQPTPNETTGPHLTLVLQLSGATVVPAAQVTGIRPDQGHIHVSVDNKLVSMAYWLTQPLSGLSPGPHSVLAEFVASDHLPFANRVTAAVLFQVRP